MYNFQISAAAEMIALAPKAPHIAAEGQLEGHEVEWAEANRRNFPVLTYKPISSANGSPMGPPQRNVAEPPIQAMAVMIRQADNDLKAVTGIYDASLGQQGPAQSGRAVLLRQQQSNIANLNYTDNMARAIRWSGIILLDMIPRVYTEQKVRRIIKPDGETQQVTVGNSQGDGLEQDELAAVPRIFDVGVGKYDVTVTVGPTYESKRKESVASQVALISAYPAIMPIAGDLLVRNMDWPGANEIADRLKAMLPPAIQQMEGAISPQQTQAQMMQLQQQNHILAAALQQSQQVISQKLIEGQSRENIALLQELTKLNVARINASKDMDQNAAERETDMLQTMMGQAHEAGSQAMEHQHDMQMQQDQQQADQQMQQQGAQPTGASPEIPPPGQPGGTTPAPGQ
jgi:hypothetical protein